VKFALRIFGEVQDEMELRFAGLESAGVDAFDDGGWSGDLGARRNGGA